MPFAITTATKKVCNLQKRIRCIQGGTSASKTISVLLFLIDAAQTDTTPTLTSIVSESLPHLKRGAMRDFLMIMEHQKYYDDNAWNRSDHTYTFETGSKIEFFGADQPGKVHGPRRDRLFINEANNVPYKAFDQLEVRTKEFIILDWNPVAEFWVYDEVIGKRDDVDHLILTYRDNEALDPNIVASIEQRKGNASWWKVYGEGQLGEVEGKIYRDWRIIDDIPHEARLERYGVDFGYSNDPTAIVAVYYHNGGYILDQILFQKGLSNKQLADVLLSQEQRCLCVADSAEPKSIDEIMAYGVNITPAEKGKDSVTYGIQLVQNQRISVTKRSVDVIKEYRNYLWKIDKDGKNLNVPEHMFSHSMDAVRYALANMLMTERGYDPLDELRVWQNRQRAQLR